MPFQWLSVPAFGGGLDYSVHPGALQNAQCTGDTGWICRDGYAETAPDYAMLVTLPLAAGEQIIGLVQNPFGQDGALVGVVGAPGFGNGRLFLVTGQGVVTEITTGVGFKVTGSQSAVFRGAFLANEAVLCFGMPGGVGASVIIWDGGPTYIFPTAGPPFAHYLAGFVAHVVLGLGSSTSAIEQSDRTVLWSSVNNPSDWVPTIFNDADDVVLDDIDSGVTMLAPISANLCAIATRNSISALVPTGAIPAYSRQLLVWGIGCVGLRTGNIASPAFRAQSFFGRCPAGIVFGGLDNLYLLPGGTAPSPVGTPIFRAWAEEIVPTADPMVDYHQTFVWHERLGMLYCPRPSSGQDEFYVYDPKTSAWSRILPTPPLLPGERFLRSGFIYSYDAGGHIQREHWLTSATSVYRETPTTPIFSGTIDTKDFAFADPPSLAYVDRIKVDWEGLTSAVSDAIAIEAAVHDDYTHQTAFQTGGSGVTFIGSQGADTANFNFVPLGTLAMGESELPVRLKGKYIRFRFRQVSGQLRLRGFRLRWRPASDKRAA